MIRLGLIGGGKTVRIAHAPALQALYDEYELVALADPSPEAREETGVLLGVPPAQRYSDYREMLLRETLDVVDIAVPHAYHHEMIMNALLAGTHVITERPLALSLHDAEELLGLAESRGKQITVLHYLLFYPPFREAIRLVREGTIGDPFFIRCEGVTGGYNAGTESYHPAWHDYPEIAGGGVWMDSGYHAAYLCDALMGSPIIGVAANISTYTTELPVDDTAIVLLTHGNNGTSSVQVAWSVPSGGQRIFEIYGSRGTIVLDHEENPLGLYRNADATWEHPHIPIDRDASFKGIFAALAECLHYGAPPPVTHREALHTLDIVLAGYRAGEQSCVEAVPE